MAVKPSNVKVGDLMAFVYWGEVTSATKGGEKLKIKSVDTNNEFFVDGRDLIETAFSADRYNNTQSVTKTEAAEILVSSYNRPFTVAFTKADGSTRTLRGRLIKPEPLLGRSMVQDLDISDGESLRQVDHRTISSIVVDNVKYEVK